MKTTFRAGLGFGALLFALSPACTVTTTSDDDDTNNNDPTEDAGDSSDETGTDDDTNADSGSTDTNEVDAGDDVASDAGDDSTDDIDVTLEPGAGDAGDSGTVAAGPGRNGCGEDADEATIVSGSITDDVTWSGDVKVEGSLQLRDGSSLTIEPGTRIVMAVDSSIEIGWNNGAATLYASGTEDQPIVICGESEEPGYWESFIIGGNVTSDSTLQHVRIFDGGGDADAALELDATVLVDNVLVSNSSSAGVAAIDFDDESENLSVTESERAVILLGDGAATRFPLGGTFTDNEETLARVAFTAVTTALIFPNIGIPYLQERTLQIREGGSVQFDAGVEYRFSTDTLLEVGWNSGASEIQVNGTEEAPVVFRGREQEPGFWGGLIIRTNVLSSSRLSYLSIHDGGGDDEYALEIDAEIELDHVSLLDNELGVSIGAQGLKPSSTTLTVSGTESYPITVEPEGLVTLPTGGDLTGNSTDQVRVPSGNYTIEGTVPNLGVPYRLEGQFQTRDGSSLTIEAGTEFLMGPDSLIVVGWNNGSATIVAEGTEEAPIRFSGAAEEAGYWEGIEVGSNVLSDSAFRWVEFAHAGGDGFVLDLNRALTVENCSFSDYDGVAILKLEDDTSDYADSNTFSGDAVAND